MRVFKIPDGRILQLADPEKMAEWNAEMPLLFIGAIKEKQLPQYRKAYPKEIVQEIEVYLEELLEHVAIPKLINALSSESASEKLAVAENIYNLSESNPDQLAIALPHIEKAIKDPNKIVSDFMIKAQRNYQKAQRKKMTAEKRKKLSELRKKMDKLDIEFAEGIITDNQYLSEQKAFLKLKREIDLEETVE